MSQGVPKELGINAQLEHLQSKYVGTGHAEANKYEWLSNQLRDSYSSFVGHPALLSYLSIAEGKSLARTKYEYLDRMVNPCGPAPKLED
mmetsp:Transcript_21433/g.29992  ORF Transcript_21433/g.29992 Transcript_21433/m.29992 type:complete len:89 (+) Transcript_21433:3-269(+)